MLGRRAGTACNYILPSHLFCQKWCIDLNGRILELLNQFRARRIRIFLQTQNMSVRIAAIVSPRFL